MIWTGPNDAPLSTRHERARRLYALRPAVIRARPVYTMPLRVRVARFLTGLWLAMRWPLAWALLFAALCICGAAWFLGLAPVAPVWFVRG